MEPASKAAALARSYDAARAALALVDGVTAPAWALIELCPPVIRSATQSTASLAQAPVSSDTGNAQT